MSLPFQTLEEDAFKSEWYEYKVKTRQTIEMNFSRQVLKVCILKWKSISMVKTRYITMIKSNTHKSCLC